MQHLFIDAQVERIAFVGKAGSYLLSATRVVDLKHPPQIRWLDIDAFDVPFSLDDLLSAITASSLHDTVPKTRPSDVMRLHYELHKENRATSDGCDSIPADEKATCKDMLLFSASNALSTADGAQVMRHRIRVTLTWAAHQLKWLADEKMWSEKAWAQLCSDQVALHSPHTAAFACYPPDVQPVTSTASDLGYQVSLTPPKMLLSRTKPCLAP